MNTKLTFRLDSEPLTQFVELEDKLDVGNGLFVQLLFKGGTVLFVADYKEAFAMQGRDGMSSSRCLHCTATSSDWKPGDDECEVSKITLDMLNACDKSLGCKTKPLINLPPDRFITPLLHLLLGLINDVWKKGILPTAINLGGGDKEEVELRTTRTDNLHASISNQRKLIAPYQKIQNSQKSRLKYWESKDQDKLTDKQVETMNKYRIALTANESKLKPLKATLEKYHRQMRKVKSDIEKIVEKRTNNIDSIDTLIKDELTNRGIFLEVYHGGTLTGNNCKKLCEKANDFIGKACNICIDQYELNTREGNIPANSPASILEVKQIFKRFEDVLSIADAAFSNLNIIAPTSDEIKTTEESVRRLGQVWMEVTGVTHTTKVHSLLEHACDCQKRFGGLGDKTEQGIETRHQIQKQMCYRLKRFGGNFESRMKKQLEYEWRQRHPAVEQLIFSVDKSIRKCKCSELTLAEENSMKRRSVQDEDRSVFMMRLCAELDAEAGEGVSADVKENESGESVPTGNVIVSIQNRREEIK